MPTEQFSVSEFESALPVDKQGNKLWSDAPWLTVEHSYYILVNPDVEILVTSSIYRGYSTCSETGKNSIRCWLADSWDHAPLASKKDAGIGRWIARTANWRDNLTRTLRELYKIGLLLGTCPICKKGNKKLRRVKKDGPNKGRTYITCEFKGESCKGTWVWLDEVIKDKAGVATR